MKDLQVGVKIFLKNKEGKYFTMQRGVENKPTDGMWDIPGGRINTGITLQANLKREVFEEVGVEILNIESAKLICAQDIIREKIHVVRLTYLHEVVDDSFVPKLSHEHMGYKWATLAELKELVNNDEITLAGTNYLQESILSK